MTTTSCKKWVDPSINTDPNNPSSVYSALILSCTEGQLAFWFQGFDYVGVTGMWVQYFEGLDRQAFGMYNYTYTSDDCDNLYTTLYEVMENCKQIIDRTSVSGETSPHIRGMAEVLKAVALGTAVGLWGDIPNSTALQGSSQLKPTFDKEADVYTAIQTLLTNAIADLSVAGTDFEEKYIHVADQDLIYAGNTAQWIKAAYSLKARYEMRLTRQAAYFNADDVLTDLTSGITNTSDDFQFNFIGNENGVDDNPLWEFTEARYGYAGDNQQFIDLLTANSDPRLPAFYDGDLFIGGPALGYPNSPSLFTSNFEGLFIKSECLWIQGDAAGAATAYNAAVAASLDKWGVTDAGWLSINAAETAGSITLPKIMNGKYIAMFAQGESWCDYRRYQFAYPVLTPPVTNATNGVQPSSYPYPTNEKVSNGANVPTRGGITAKLWAFE